MKALCFFLACVLSISNGFTQTSADPTGMDQSDKGATVLIDLKSVLVRSIEIYGSPVDSLTIDGMRSKIINAFLKCNSVINFKTEFDIKKYFGIGVILRYRYEVIKKDTGKFGAYAYIVAEIYRITDGSIITSKTFSMSQPNFGDTEAYVVSNALIASTHLMMASLISDVAEYVNKK